MTRVLKAFEELPRAVPKQGERIDAVLEKGDLDVGSTS